MQIDQDRIRAILQSEHSYYGSREIPIRRDTRWHPGVVNLVTQQLSPAMRVLDVGCGDGEMLLELSPSFQFGIGVDHNP